MGITGHAPFKNQARLLLICQEYYSVSGDYTGLALSLPVRCSFSLLSTRPLRSVFSLTHLILNAKSKPKTNLLVNLTTDFTYTIISFSSRISTLASRLLGLTRQNLPLTLAIGLRMWKLI